MLILDEIFNLRFLTFQVQVDKIRIPSTKRTCLIGRSKSTSVSKDVLWNYVNGLKPQAKFTPRPAEEQVRNCTKLPKDLIESVVEIVTKKMCEGLKVGEWQSEEGLGMGEAAKLIPDDMKSQMKKEFGGLQTLLKNNHNIFQIHGGVVRFRLPKLNLELKSKGRWKNRNCWFFFNHPSGCPLNDAECSYKHECDV
jgi:tRNASer (uridine44-2'-O)-methyltransferase